MKCILYILTLTVFILSSCKKEETPSPIPPSPPINRSPEVNVGPDLQVSLPLIAPISINYNLADPDGNTVNFDNWTKILGPGYYYFTPVPFPKGLWLIEQGQYQFEIKVSDRGGLTGLDTLNITAGTFRGCPQKRELIQLDFTHLTRKYFDLYSPVILAYGDLIIFTSRNLKPEPFIIGDPSDRSLVAIFDTKKMTWSESRLSSDRRLVATAATGNKLFFAGGGGSPIMWSLDSTVDVYDIVKKTWSVEFLSVARRGITTAVVGSKVFFAGGFDKNGASKVIDIYDVSTGKWSAMLLPESKGYMTSIVVDDKIYFAGGYAGLFYLGENSKYLSTIDIYDVTNNIWTRSHLATPRIAISAISLNQKIYFAGGFNDYFGDDVNSHRPEYIIDILDINTGNVTETCLSSGSFAYNAYAAIEHNGAIYFLHAENQLSVIDIYDPSVNSWKYSPVISDQPFNYLVKNSNGVFLIKKPSGNSIEINKIEF